MAALTLLRIVLVCLFVSVARCSSSGSDRHGSDIRQRVDVLKARMQTTGSYRQRMDMLKGAFKGVPMYLLACGPSASMYDMDELEAAMADGVVVGIKQAALLVPNIIDFHLSNVVNLQAINYSRVPIQIHQSDGRVDHLGALGIQTHLTAEMLVYFDQARFTNAQQLVFNHDMFDEYTFEKTLLRPWGPGIVFEIGLYLAQHLGVTEVRVLGWDLTNDYHHFWEGPKKNLDQKRPDTFVSFGGEYGASMQDLQNEFSNVRATAFAASQWLAQYNVRFVCLSPISTIDSRIPREYLKARMREPPAPLTQGEATILTSIAASTAATGAIDGGADDSDVEPEPKAEEVVTLLETDPRHTSSASFVPNEHTPAPESDAANDGRSFGSRGSIRLIQPLHGGIVNVIPDMPNVWQWHEKIDGVYHVHRDQGIVAVWNTTDIEVGEDAAMIMIYFDGEYVARGFNTIGQAVVPATSYGVHTFKATVFDADDEIIDEAVATFVVADIT